MRRYPDFSRLRFKGKEFPSKLPLFTQGVLSKRVRIILSQQNETQQNQGLKVGWGATALGGYADL
ncbi:hypothetical protein [Nostoc sp.]|uniref:hypothetical protein n=1 Tax=Nostoc sp. TaxID=1180 RepID=UPI002FF1A37B